MSKDEKVNTTEIIKHSSELNFTIVAKPGEYAVEFTIYNIVAWVEGDTVGVYDTPVWEKKGFRGEDWIQVLDQPWPYLHGTIKWDGIADWYFDEQDRSMLHEGSRKGLLRNGEIMALCWDWMPELCPNWGKVNTNDGNLSDSERVLLHDVLDSVDGAIIGLTSDSSTVTCGYVSYTADHCWAPLKKRVVAEHMIERWTNYRDRARLAETLQNSQAGKPPA